MNVKERNSTKKMSRLRHNIYLRSVKLINIILVTIPFAMCWYMYYQNGVTTGFAKTNGWMSVLLFAALYFLLARVYDGLQVSLHRVSEMIYSQVLAFLIVDAILYVDISFVSEKLANILPGVLCIFGQFILSAAWSTVAHRWYFKVFSAQKSAVVYETREGLDALINEYGLSKKFAVENTFTTDECLSDLHLLDEYETVFASGVHSHARNIILKYCVEKDINLYIIPRIGDVIMSGAKQMHLFHLPMLRAGRYNPSPIYLAIKRAFDIVISLLMLIILSPFMLITAIVIKTDGGPVFYKQERLTKDGKTFNVIKFRSMRVDAEKDGVARLSTGEDDDRITKVGKIIRKIRFDELPQLINILVGDMTIVGPRPERPEIAEQYEIELPEFRLRLQAKAGLTGYAQVYGKYNTTPYDKLVMDLMYIANPSIIEDLKIIFATVKILFLPESTEGVAVGATTAMGYENAADSTENDAETVAK